MTSRSGHGYAGYLLLALFMSSGLSGGCQSVPPAPTDRYYRLADVPAQSIIVEQWTSGSIEIPELRADGPYLDRAILFTNEEPAVGRGCVETRFTLAGWAAFWPGERHR